MIKTVLLLMLFSLTLNAKSVDYDLNGDGNADILWKSGLTYYRWYMKSNGSYRYQKYGKVSKGYTIGAMGDFNDDGTVDILWRKKNINLIAYLKPNGKKVYKKITKNSDSLEGVADFNNDGVADLLWKKNSKYYIWYMKSNGKYKRKNIGSKGSLYSVVAVADFNGDGKADILWKNSKKYSYSLWYMKSSGGHNYEYIGTKKYIHIAGVADFNGDKKADILWEDREKYSIWYIQSNGKHKYKYIGKKTVDYAIVNVADFNGDKKADILWRNGKHTSIWYMQSNGKHKYKKLANKDEKYYVQKAQYNLSKNGYKAVLNSRYSIRSIKAIHFKKTGKKRWENNVYSGRLQPNHYTEYPIWNCDNNYDIKVVYTDNKILTHKKVYIGCNTKYYSTFTLYKSTISHENVNCSVDGKNKMLYDIMKDSYFWYEHTPTVDYEAYDSLEDLLKRLKYKKYDKWSYITTLKQYNNYFEEGTYIGFGFTLGFKKKRAYFRYVYKDSPAYKAGFRRGTEVLSVNGKTIKEIDSKKLWSSIFGKQKIGVKVKFKVKTNSKIKTVTVKKAKVKQKTVLSSKILKSGGKKIGYLAFKGFIEPSRAELRKAFAKFKKEHIGELILDLRYNGGGRLSIAQYLGSLIGGKKTQGSIFETLQYNDKFSHWNWDYKFTKETYSLGLSNLYVISTNGTASASESVINGLKPFLNVKLIGSRTHGKPVGMNGYSFCGKHVSPIMFTGLNANDSGNYFKGFKVTCKASDDIKYDFGSTKEPMLKETLYYIKNHKCSTKSRKRSTIELDDEKRNSEIYQGFSAEIGAI